MKTFKEYSEEINEGVKGVSVDREFTKMNSMSRDIKDEWRDIRRAVKKSLDVPEKELDQIGDDIEDALIDLNKALNAAQDKIKSWDK